MTRCEEKTSEGEGACCQFFTDRSHLPMREDKLDGIPHAKERPSTVVVKVLPPAWLYRERRLSAVDLTGRLRALHGLAAGKLLPPLAALPSRTVS